MTDAFTPEMPTAWVRAVDEAIEALGHPTADAHESAIILPLTADTRPAVDADTTDQYVIVSWDEAGPHWGLGETPARIDYTRPLGGITPEEIAGRVDMVLRTGRPEPRPGVQHAVPYVAVATPECCPVVYPCGGIVPDADCAEHGNQRTPVMAWHWETNCPPTPAA
ncbi:hypothetical protein [Streptomyces sp. NPDC059258]|uniref:hypothetical protein n=1 Tax=unclassified Streptomyces TaxID=2593676 RepID=UPI0036C0B17F